MKSLSVRYPEDFRTPAFIVDAAQVRANAMDVSQRVAGWGLHFRPHLKTHKTLEIAEIQVADLSAPVTVSTLAEAVFYADAGYTDILYAFPVTADKLKQAFDLAKIIRFSIVTDHPETVRAIAAFGEKAASVLGVYLKVDTGTGRAGLLPDDVSLPEMARVLHESAGVDFRGVLTHAGHTYTIPYPEALSAVLAEEANKLKQAASAIEAAGVPCPERSLGSTPASRADHDGTIYDGITELRAGNYIFFDRFMSECGHCSVDEIACFVASRIIAVYPERNNLLIDAGALGLSKDLGPTHLSHFKGGYGLIHGHPELIITRLSQEHGLVSSESEIDFSQFKPGQILHIAPNHSCLTAALYPEYHWLEDGELTRTIVPVRGW